VTNEIVDGGLDGSRQVSVLLFQIATTYKVVDFGLGYEDSDRAQTVAAPLPMDTNALGYRGWHRFIL